MREEIAREYLERKYDEYRMDLINKKWEKEDRGQWCEIVSITLGVITIITVSILIDIFKYSMPSAMFILFELLILALCNSISKLLKDIFSYRINKHINFNKNRMEEIKEWI